MSALFPVLTAKKNEFTLIKCLLYGRCHSNWMTDFTIPTRHIPWWSPFCRWETEAPGGEGIGHVGRKWQSGLWTQSGLRASTLKHHPKFVLWEKYPQPLASPSRNLEGPGPGSHHGPGAAVPSDAGSGHWGRDSGTGRPPPWPRPGFPCTACRSGAQTSQSPAAERHRGRWPALREEAGSTHLSTLPPPWHPQGQPGTHLAGCPHHVGPLGVRQPAESTAWEQRQHRPAGAHRIGWSNEEMDGWTWFHLLNR